MAMSDYLLIGMGTTVTALVGMEGYREGFRDTRLQARCLAQRTHRRSEQRRGILHRSHCRRLEYGLMALEKVVRPGISVLVYPGLDSQTDLKGHSRQFVAP
jgi:hypothetical protein